MCVPTMGRRPNVLLSRIRMFSGGAYSSSLGRYCRKGGREGGREGWTEVGKVSVGEAAKKLLTLPYTYHVKGDDWLREVGIIGGILDVLAPDNGPPTLYLHEGGVDREELEPLHVPDTPTQYLHACLLQDRADSTGDNVVGVRGGGGGRGEGELTTLVLEGGKRGAKWQGVNG